MSVRRRCTRPLRAGEITNAIARGGGTRRSELAGGRAGVAEADSSSEGDAVAEASQEPPPDTWKQITRRCTGTATSREKGIVVFNPGSISVTRYRYRGARIPNPQGIPASVDPSSLRVYCASREEQRSRVGVQQAPA